MKPILLEIEQLSEEPGDNYLQFLLSFAVAQHSTEIYFYFEKKNIRVCRNAIAGGDFSELKKHLPPEVIRTLQEFALTIASDLEKRVVPKGFFDEVPLPISFRDKLEIALKQIYQLKSLQELENSQAYRDINVSGIKIRTSLERIPQREGYGYHMKISYLDPENPCL